MIIYRTSAEQVTTEVTTEVQRVLLALDREMKRSEIQQLLQLKNDEHFRKYYILPALEEGYIQMKYPDRPNHPQQRYQLTAKGETLKEKMKSK